MHHEINPTYINQIIFAVEGGDLLAFQSPDNMLWSFSVNKLRSEKALQGLHDLDILGKLLNAPSDELAELGGTRQNNPVIQAY